MEKGMTEKTSGIDPAELNEKAAEHKVAKRKEKAAGKKAADRKAKKRREAAADMAMNVKAARPAGIRGAVGRVRERAYKATSTVQKHRRRIRRIRTVLRIADGLLKAFLK